MLYRIVKIVNGETEEPVNIVGVHPLKWNRIAEDTPDVAFAEYDVLEQVKGLLQELMDARERVGYGRAMSMAADTQEEFEVHTFDAQDAQETSTRVYNEIIEVLR